MSQSKEPAPHGRQYASPRLAPHLDRIGVGAYEELLPGSNSSILCRALPRKAPSSDLRCASGPMLSIPSSGRLALYSDTAWQNPPWVYGAAARGANSSNAPSGQYQLARTLVTDPQSPPPILRAGGGGRGCLGAGPVPTVAQAIDVAASRSDRTSTPGTRGVACAAGGSLLIY